MKIGIIHRVPWTGSYWEEACPIGHSVVLLSKKDYWGNYLVAYADGLLTKVDCSDIEILTI